MVPTQLLLPTVLYNIEWFFLDIFDALPRDTWDLNLI